MRKNIFGLSTLFLIAACGVDNSGARVANMSQQEANALNDAAAIIDERTEKVGNILNGLDNAQAPQAAAPQQNSQAPNSSEPPAKTEPSKLPPVQNSVVVDNPQKK